MTRDRARRAVAWLARKTERKESEVSRTAIALAAAADRDPERQVLHYLIGDGAPELERRLSYRPSLGRRFERLLKQHGTTVHVATIMLLTACFCAVALGIAVERGVTQPTLLAILAALAALPLSELSIQILHSLVISAFPPNILPKLDFRDGIPEEDATLVVVPMMLTGGEAIRREVEKLEIRSLANRERNLWFALFSDYTDAAEKTTPADAALLKTAREGIAELNKKYGEGRFLLFHRERKWSETQKAWIGRERKRGKLEELNTYLCEGKGDILAEGRLPKPIRYVITLDADTQLPPGAGKRLIETIAHPLNQAQIDEAKGVRRSGYTIIQPRVSIGLPGATATRFTRIFSDAQGTDPYCTAVSDAQQDLLGEAIFHGKAIYDVRAFHRILHERFPAETLLSHDLIEGAYVGVGLATDIELLENLPLDYGTFAHRQHRWIRGDWQIAAWATRRIRNASGRRTRNPLSFINRWRIFDNLRRSLVPIASVLLLASAWFFSVTPAVWTLALALAVVIPALVPVLDRWSRQLEGTVSGWQGAWGDLERAIVMVVFLPHQAWLSADAIARVIHRKAVSRRRLLEWKTAEAAQRGQGTHASSTGHQLNIIAACAAAAFAGVAAKGASVPTFVFLGMWMVSPWVMRWLAQPQQSSWLRPISRLETGELRRLARRTWRFFDDLVGPQTHWLPPDNTQLALRVEVAMRTSPTNIGLWLNSALAAHDFGYLTTDGFAARCTETFTTIARLERYDGHPLNWYSLDDLRPLPPQYVSTVDSGNLIASLWTLAEGASRIGRAPVVDTNALQGIEDLLGILNAHSGMVPALLVAMRGLVQTVRTPAEGFEIAGQLRLAGYQALLLKGSAGWSTEAGDEASYWVGKLVAELDAWSVTIDRHLRWMEVVARASEALVQSLGATAVDQRRRILRHMPSLEEIAQGPGKDFAALLDSKHAGDLRPEVADWLATAEREFHAAQANARETLDRLAATVKSAQELASGINMGLLYDRDRRLFGIGYAVGQPLKFSSHYDLLASECRLASLVSIAKGDVPLHHWFALGRPRVSTPSRRALLSWSGTMFEYLMPLLFTESFDNSLLDTGCRECVGVQMQWGKTTGLPWGVSECAYSALDANQIYQYKAFGVRGLALDPHADAGPVVAPYATVMALMLNPSDSLKNLDRLESLGLRGPMGFYESIDFTGSEKQGGRPGVLIFAFMAHHQGMSLLALDSVVNGRRMQRRFHADPRVRAVESLLFERVPIARLEPEPQPEPAPQTETAQVQERGWAQKTPLPHVHISSNSRYSVVVTNNGGGYSRWKDFDITRWQADTALDSYGCWVWLRDMRTGAIWSPSHHPFGRVGEAFVSFTASSATLGRRTQDIEAKVEVAVAENDAEVRVITVSNRSLRSRSLELTVYTELALAPHAADQAHPAFSKMFVETEVVDGNVLLARRRPRTENEAAIWVSCTLTGGSGALEFETDRRAFLGRTNRLANAQALRQPLGGTTGAVLDPIFSFRAKLTLEARDQERLCFALAAAATREEALARAREYQRPSSAPRALETAWTRAQLQFRHLRIPPAAANQYDELAGSLIYPSPRMRASKVRMDLLGGQESLWKNSISGDLPIVLVTVAETQGLELVRQLLLAHAYWRVRGLEADLVILNRESGGYDAPVQHELTRLIQAHSSVKPEPGKGGVYLLERQRLSPGEEEELIAAARVTLSGHRGPLQQQLLGAEEGPAIPKLNYRTPTASSNETGLAPLELELFNGVGGFTKGGREYAIELAPGVRPPHPWANVIANEKFGSVVTESNLGFTWFGNSQTNRLTPWNNDPVSDLPAEAIYLRDEQSGKVWTATALPIPAIGPARVRHGQGYSVYEQVVDGIVQELTVFVPRHDPVKVCRLRLRNASNETRRISATFYTDLVLGSTKEQQQTHIATSYEPVRGAVLAEQRWTGSFRGNCAFLASSPRPSSYTGNRLSFSGAGAPERPAALEFARLDGRCGAGFDPCAALQTVAEIAAGASAEIVFLLGQAPSQTEASDLIDRYSKPKSVESALNEVTEWWDGLLGAVQVKTGIPSVDLLMNRWLLYQSLCCRIWGRSAVYQSGGALGFRDQLQDCLALVYAAPELSREHIVNVSSHQFEEGDVQHWWHPESGLGVRTRCSDDMLWLPWVVATYVEITGDESILDIKTPFLEGQALTPQETDKMFPAREDGPMAPLREHCIRAIEHGSRLGEHGLPLIGSGDWNDGMNDVGKDGKGESGWLAWFLVNVLETWQGMMQASQPALAGEWKERARAIRASMELHGWDGEWYLRGFFDDGSPLGSHGNSEAQIDSIAQSWAVIAGADDQQRAEQAMRSAENRLVLTREKIVLLFTPPFDTSLPHPGYIMGYPPGTRENGGQYTHAALWLAKAFAMLGDGGAAARILLFTNPAEHTKDRAAVSVYRGEPYAVAADVSASPLRTGTAGWTWYTGSAGWMYRVWLEDVLGLRVRGERMEIHPAIPDDWPGFELTYRHKSSVYRFEVKRKPDGSLDVFCNGELCTGRSISLGEDGSEHLMGVGTESERR